MGFCYASPLHLIFARPPNISLVISNPSHLQPPLTDHLHQSRRINSRSVFLGCKYALRQSLSQPLHPSGHRGWIINTASMLGLVGLKPSAGAYCTSKGAVVLLTKQIAVEYGIDKIHCNALCPGCKSQRSSDILLASFSV